MPEEAISKAEARKAKKISPKVANAVERKSKLPTAVLIKAKGNYSWAGPSRAIDNSAEYDLDLIDTAEDVEGILARIINRMQAVSWKSGTYIKVLNPSVMDYVQKRLLEMRLVQNTSFNFILKKAYKHVLKYSNAFIIKVRDQQYSSGRIHRMYGKDLEPIAGLEIADPTTMVPIRDVKEGVNYGRVIAWQQIKAGSKPRRIPLEDVIHIKFNEKSDFVFGTPLVVPVLDDIRSLRRVEQMADVSAAKNAFPLLHYKIGDGKEVLPEEFGPGDTEIARARNQMDSMGPDDILVTSGHHVIEAVNIDGAYQDTSALRQHYLERVVSGMGASLIDIGLSGAATKDTANNISQNLIDLMTDVQSAFCEYVNKFLLEIVLENGTYELSYSNIPEFHFEGIDWEARHARETHNLSLMNAGAITIDEYRMTVGRQPLKPDEYKNTVMEKYQKSPEVNGVANKANPQNQQGKRGAAAPKTKRKDEQTMPIIRPIPAAVGKALSLYSLIKSDILDAIKLYRTTKDNTEAEHRLRAVKKSLEAISVRMSSAVNDSIVHAMNYGKDAFVKEHRSEITLPLDMLPFFKEVMRDAFTGLQTSIKDGVLKALDSKVFSEDAIRESFEVNKYRIEFVIRTELNAIRNSTFATLASRNGYTQASWWKRANCEQCKENSSTVDINNLEYSSLRALVPNCGDVLRLSNAKFSTDGFTRFPCRG